MPLALPEIPRALELFRQMFHDGGLVTTTTLRPSDSAPAIRSLVQIDGDVVVTVGANAVGDPELGAAWTRHLGEVRERLAVLPRATAALQSSARIAGGVGGIVGALWTYFDGRRGVVALGVAVACLLAGQAERVAFRVLLRGASLFWRAAR